MKRDDLMKKIIFSSVPLKELSGENNKPIGAASGCLVMIRNKKLILTVKHATGNMGRWAVEIKHDILNSTTEYYQTHMNFMSTLSFGTSESKVADLSYARLPDDFVSYIQQFDKYGRVTFEKQRIIYKMKKKNLPNKNKKYGFAGLSYPDGSFWIKDEEKRLVMDMKYIGENSDYFIFKLPGEHPGHDYFKGTSGAPIIDNDGELTSLVSKGDENDNIVYGIKLWDYYFILDFYCMEE